jgi:CDGSH-type Zn-finger protein
LIERTKSEISRRKGHYFELKAGGRYFWCSCGRSKQQPFCDGSHAGTGFAPVAFTAARDEEVILCGCKQTGSAPFCDGSHSSLPGGYAAEDPAPIGGYGWSSQAADRSCVSTGIVVCF